MFTTGRIVFLILFVLAFVIAIAWGYRQDIKKNKELFNGVSKFLIVVLIVTAILQVLVKVVLK